MESATSIVEELQRERSKNIQLEKKYNALKEQFTKLALSTETHSELVANKLMKQIRNIEQKKIDAENQEIQLEERLKKSREAAVLSHQQFEAEQESISLSLQRKIEEEKKQRQELEDRLRKVELDLVATDHIKEMMNLIRQISYETKYVSDEEVEELEGKKGDKKATCVLVELNKAIHRLLEKNKLLQDENDVLSTRMMGLKDELYIVHEKNTILQQRLFEIQKQNVDANMLLEIGDEQKFNEKKRPSISSQSSHASTPSNASSSIQSVDFVSDQDSLEQHRSRMLFDLHQTNVATIPSPLLTAQTPEITRSQIAFETLSLDSQ